MVIVLLKENLGILRVYLQETLFFSDPIGCGICDRTLKFFQGLSQKCWILDYQWVTDCRAAGHLLPEVQYYTLQ